MSDTRKKVLVVVSKAPHGTFYAQEALDVMFITTAYEIDLHVLFTADGVLSLKSRQNARAVDMKGFIASIGALAEWDITNVYVDADAMQNRGLQASDLVSIGEDEETEQPLYAKPVSTSEMRDLMATSEAILPF
jgi:tRNA 2-thiouridine synthesizing protein C